MPTALLAMPQGMEWLVILLIVVLVFGAAKLPDLARSSGQALRIFKTETKGLKDEEDSTGDNAVPGELKAPEASSSDSIVREQHGDTTS